MTLPKLFCVPAMWAACAGALAQNPPAPAPLSAMSQTPVYDPGQLPAYTGRLQQFTLTPRGEIDGLILSDGTEVKTPPHLSTAIAYSVKLGDTVRVHGLRAAALPLVQAVSITDQANGRTIIDNGPPALGAGPPPPPPGPRAGPPLPPPTFGPGTATPLPGLSEVQGRVRMSLHSPQGEVNGALLENGTVLRLPPPAAATFTALLQPGHSVVAEGVGLSNALGKVIEVRQIGTSREQLNYVDTQAPSRGRKRGPPDALAALPRSLAPAAGPR
jgi:hypothetical protein